MNDDQREAELGVLASKVVAELTELGLPVDCHQHTQCSEFNACAWQVVYDALEFAALNDNSRCEFCRLPYRPGWAHTPDRCWDVQANLERERFNSYDKPPAGHQLI